MNKKASTLIKRIRKLAEQYPNATYQPGPTGCEYYTGHVKNGPITEGCLVGQAARGYVKIPSWFTGPVELLLELTGPPKEWHWLEDVQTAQDIGKRWGWAVQEADRLEADRNK